MNNITHDEIREINLACVQLKARLFELGLFETAHKMDEVTKNIGWETADIIQNKHVTKLLLGKRKHVQLSK